jgi:hypothetical protein
VCWTGRTLPSENRVPHRVGRAELGGIVVTAAGSWKFPLVECRGQLKYVSVHLMVTEQCCLMRGRMCSACSQTV